MSRELLQRALDLLCERDPFEYDNQTQELERDIRAELAKQEERDADYVLAYAKGYEDGRDYVTHRVKLALSGREFKAPIDCGLFEIRNCCTIANINLDDGLYQLLAVRRGDL